MTFNNKINIIMIDSDIINNILLLFITIRIIFSFHKLDCLFWFADGTWRDTTKSETGAINLTWDEFLSAIIQRFMLETITN